PDRGAEPSRRFVSASRFDRVQSGRNFGGSYVGDRPPANTNKRLWMASGGNLRLSLCFPVYFGRFWTQPNSDLVAKIMEANLLAPDLPIRFAEIRLCMARTMAQRYKHLPPPQHRLGYIFAHDRITAGKALLVPQSLKNPAR